MKVDKYIKKKLKYFYRIKENRKPINNFIEGQLERLYDLQSDGLTEAEAVQDLITKLGNLTEFKQSLIPYEASHKAYANFIFSLFSTIFISVILLLININIKFNYTYIVAIITAIMFWPLSMWVHYYKKL